MGLFEEEKKTHHCLGQRVQLDFKYRGQRPAWLSAVPLGSVLFRLAQCCSAQLGSVLFRTAWLSAVPLQCKNLCEFAKLAKIP